MVKNSMLQSGLFSEEERVGYVSEFRMQPDLEESGWESREALARLVHFDRWGSHEGAIQP